MAPEHATVFDELKNRYRAKYPTEAVEVAQGWVKSGATVEPKVYFTIRAGCEGNGEWHFESTDNTLPTVLLEFDEYLKEQNL